MNSRTSVWTSNPYVAARSLILVVHLGRLRRRTSPGTPPRECPVAFEISANVIEPRISSTLTVPPAFSTVFSSVGIVQAKLPVTVGSPMPSGDERDREAEDGVRGRACGPWRRTRRDHERLLDRTHVDALVAVDALGVVDDGDRRHLDVDRARLVARLAVDAGVGVAADLEDRDARDGAQERAHRAQVLAEEAVVDDRPDDADAEHGQADGRTRRAARRRSGASRRPTGRTVG